MPQLNEPTSAHDNALRKCINGFIDKGDTWTCNLFKATQTTRRNYTYVRRCVMAECRGIEHMFSELPYGYKKAMCTRLATVFASMINTYDHRVREVNPEFWNEERHSSLCLAMFRSVLTPCVHEYDCGLTSTPFKQKLVLQALDRVPNLTSLYLTHSPETNSSTELASVFRHLPSLETFTYRLHCTDELIEQLALHCPNLQNLYISESRGVTNNSVHLLVQLRKLQFLELDGTRINSSHYGFLLSELPEIKNIKFGRRLENIVNPLAEEDLRTILYVIGHAENINILTEKCRNITDLNLDRITGDLAGLAALTSLRCLHISKGDYAASNLNAVLTAIGPTLTEFNLFRISNVSLQDIVTHCRSLKILSLWKCLFLPLNTAEPLNPQSPHFRNLISLDIAKRRGDQTNYNYIRHYVSLKTITFDSINIFTVEFMREVVRSGTFANLEEFCVRETGRGALTMEALELLIESCSHLKIIEGLESCPRFYPGLIQGLQRRLLMRNLDLQIV